LPTPLTPSHRHVCPSSIGGHTLSRERCKLKPRRDFHHGLLGSLALNGDGTVVYRRGIIKAPAAECCAIEAASPPDQTALSA
jgi:hypothetical protein